MFFIDKWIMEWPVNLTQQSIFDVLGFVINQPIFAGGSARSIFMPICVCEDIHEQEDCNGWKLLNEGIHPGKEMVGGGSHCVPVCGVFFVIASGPCSPDSSAKRKP